MSGRKFDLENARKEICSLGFKILDEDFKNIKRRKFDVEDDEGYRYSLSYRALLENKDKIKARVVKNGKYAVYNIKLFLKIKFPYYELLSNEYRDNMITVKCHKHNYVFTTQWKYLSVLNSTACIECSKEKTLSRIHPNKLLLDLEKKHPNIEILNPKDIINTLSIVKCKCKIDGNEWDTPISNLRRTGGCLVCGNRNTGIAKRKDISEIIKQCEITNPYIIIKSKENLGSKIPLLCECKECGREFKRLPNDLTNKSYPCPHCTDRILNDGNCIAKMFPDKIIYLKNKEDGFKFKKGTHSKISLICPECGNEKSSSVSNFINKPFSCKICSDGISIPEKFVRNILIQLKIEFKNDKTLNLDGLNKRRYDIIFKNSKTVIEVNGIHHYEQSNRNKRSLEEERINDSEKRQIAINNGYEYIVIDARYSTFDWLKTNTEMQLSKYFDTSNVDWENAYFNASKSKKYESWNLYKNGMSIKEIAIELNLSNTTIKNYIKDGKDINILD